MSLIEDLNELDSLHSAGAINDDEFARAKAIVLRQPAAAVSLSDAAGSPAVAAATSVLADQLQERVQSGSPPPAPSEPRSAPLATRALGAAFVIAVVFGLLAGGVTLFMYLGDEPADEDSTAPQQAANRERQPSSASESEGIDSPRSDRVSPAPAPTVATAADTEPPTTRPPAGTNDGSSSDPATSPPPIQTSAVPSTPVVPSKAPGGLGSVAPISAERAGTGGIAPVAGTPPEPSGVAGESSSAARVPPEVTPSNESAAPRSNDERPGRLSAIALPPGRYQAFIDGQRVGSLPLRGHELPPGTYRLVVRRSDGQERSKRIRVRPGRRVSERFDFGR